MKQTKKNIRNDQDLKQLEPNSCLKKQNKKGKQKGKYVNKLPWENMFFGICQNKRSVTVQLIFAFVLTV